MVVDLIVERAQTRKIIDLWGPPPPGWSMISEPSSELDLEWFDPIAYLQDRNIEYFDSGKNVTRGWINIQCPFCQDHSNHLGINLTSKMISCWICGTKGSIVRLIREIESCSEYQARLVLKAFKRDIYSDPYQISSFRKNPAKNEDRAVFQGKIEWPKGVVSEFPKSHLHYLKKRKFDPHKTILKYKLRAGTNFGFYKFRIVIPVFLNHRIMTFVGRDITGKAIQPYKNHPEELSVLPAKHLIYNIDSVKEKIILVEGIFDCWRIGEGCGASLGTKVTKEQINLLLKRNIKEVFLFPDYDAIAEWEKLAKRISPLFDRVELVLISKGDPADLKRKEVIKLRSSIGL